MRYWVLVIGILGVVASRSVGQPLAGIKICIDPGHGGNNPANDRLVVPDPGVNFWESESNFQKALLLRPLLEARGATVILTRNTNTYPTDADPSLSARVSLANSNNVDWFHSIHSNATGGTNTSTNRTLMLVREKRSETDPAASTGSGLGVPERQESWTMAQIMTQKVKTYNRTSSFSTWLDWTFYGGASGGFSLGVLRGLLMPGELSEGSFHDYYPETRRLMNNAYREGEAYALLYSILQYYSAPTESIAIIAGIQTDAESGRPKNNSVVRLLPENRMFSGDSYFNGFFLFDSVSPGPHYVRFESPGYIVDSVLVTAEAGGIHFVDRTLLSNVGPAVIVSSPMEGDTAFPVSSVLGITFSRPMDTTSVRLAFHLEPSKTGVFTYYNNSKSVIFNPDDVLPYGTEFQWRIDSTARSAGGIMLDARNIGSPNSFVVTFRTAPMPVLVEEETTVPDAFRILGCYPNPFNPTTTIRFELPQASNVQLDIIDGAGRIVAILVDQWMNAGSHMARFDASKLPSGVYVGRLRADLASGSIRLLLIK